MDMDDQRRFRYSSTYFLRLLVTGLSCWIGANLLVGNPPLLGQYYVLVFALIYMWIQSSYKLDLRPGSLIIWRLGTSVKVDATKIAEYEQHKGMLRLHMDDGAQYKIPISRFNAEAKAYLFQLLPDREQETEIAPVSTFQEPEPEETPTAPVQADAWVQAAPEVTVKPQTRSTPPPVGLPQNLSVTKAQSEISLLLATGHTKRAVFDTLKGRGIADGKLAMLIASSPDKILYALHESKNNALIWIVFLQTALAVWATYISASAGEIDLVVAIPAVIGLLFIWGFFTRRLMAYTLFVFLSVAPCARTLMEAFMMGDTVGVVGGGISVAIVAYAWYVRSQLFPDIGLLGVRKDRQGNYVFTD